MVSMADLMLKYPLQITGVLHLGAHTGEEAADYARYGLPVWWVEANPDLIPELTRNVSQFPNNYVIQALVYDQDNIDLGLNITNVGAISSSILPFGTHAKVAPHCKYVDHKTLRTTTVDTLVAEHGIIASFLNMDLQGGEMFALLGAQKFLDGVTDVFTEINVDELYRGCVRIWELDAWLGDRGFLRLETCMAENHVGWGDALYSRNAR